MPIERPYQFELYRLYTVDKTNLFNFDDPQIANDDDLVKVFQRSTSSDFDRQTATERAKYRWSVRDFIDLRDVAPEGRPTVGFVLARSTVSQIGPVVTDNGITDETLSESSPPLAITVRIFVDLSRHLAAVEYASAVMTSAVWRTTLHEILDLASEAAKYRSSIRFEPVPESQEILTAFTSFSRLTRLRVVLTLPNPELTRFTAKLKSEMERGGIKEYTQDMRNPAGLSQAQDGLPFASAAMAQDGYKVGEVLLEGIRNGQKKVVKTGRRATRAIIERVRDAVREAFSGDRFSAKPAVISILAEVDRISVPPHLRGGEHAESRESLREPSGNGDVE